MSTRALEWIIERLLFLCAALSVLTTAGIIMVLAFETYEFLREVPIVEFLTGTEWTPLFANRHFGVLPLVAGTMLVSAIAMVVAIADGRAGRGLPERIRAERPAPRRQADSRNPRRRADGGLRLLRADVRDAAAADVSSRRLSGFNALSPGLVMGLMILPLVSSLSEDAMRAVPNGLREGSYALGATRMQTALKVVVPAAFSGITAAFILAASRAIGETMIVAIAAGQQPRLTGNPFVPIETMTAYIVQVSLGDTPQGTHRIPHHLRGRHAAVRDDVRPELDQHLAARAVPRGVRVRKHADLLFQIVSARDAGDRAGRARRAGLRHFRPTAPRD